MTGGPVVFQKRGVEGICVLPKSQFILNKRTKTSANLLHVGYLLGASGHGPGPQSLPD